MRTVLVDTGAWIALRNRDDQLHERAVAQYERLAAEGARLLTTSFIIDETATRLRYDIGLDDALRFRDLVRAAEERKRLRIVRIDRRLADEAWSILDRYADVQLSFTDATTIAAARSRKVREVFAFDDEFEVAGLDVAPGS